MDDWTVKLYLVAGYILGPVAGVATFIGAWWYCAAEYGFLWGFGFGWVPATIAAAIAYFCARFLWPLIVGLALWIWSKA